VENIVHFSKCTHKVIDVVRCDDRSLVQIITPDPLTHWWARIYCSWWRSQIMLQIYCYNHLRLSTSLIALELLVSLTRTVSILLQPRD